MKALLLIAAFTMAGPAFAETAPPPVSPPKAPVGDAREAQPGKPMVWDSQRRQLPATPKPKDKPAPGIG